MKKEYFVDITLQVLIKDVEDEDEAIEYAEDFIYGLNEIAYSSDEDDDHYEIEKSTIVSVREAY